MDIELNPKVIEACAQAAHEVNRAYCQALGDESQAPWDEAPDWQKQSAREGVREVIKNPDIAPGASHEGWLRAKKRDGWVYGPVKDPDKKEHPCMVDFFDLPVEQRAKDYLFIATVRATLAAARRGARGELA